MQSVAVVPKCVECEARWLPADADGWRMHLGCDEDLDQLAEVFLLCPGCSEWEFADD